MPSWAPISFLSASKNISTVNCPSKVDTSLAPHDHAAISVISLRSHQDAGTWRRDDPGYKERKREFGDDLISSIEEVMPGLRNNIVFREEATPTTFERYAWSTDGAIYGLAIDQWHPPMRSPVGGLYLAGAGITARPGVEDAVHSGSLAAEAVCDQLE